MQKYANLTEMLQQNPAAKKYFNSLPDYVRETIRERGDAVRHIESLKDYAENLLRGDD